MNSACFRQRYEAILRQVVRTGAYGALFGCTNYPDCKYARNVVG